MVHSLQVRIPIPDLPALLPKLANMEQEWKDLQYPKVKPTTEES